MFGPIAVILGVRTLGKHGRARCKYKKEGTGVPSFKKKPNNGEIGSV